MLTQTEMKNRILVLNRVLNKLNSITDILNLSRTKKTPGSKDKIKKLLAESYVGYCSVQSDGFDNLGNSLYSLSDKLNAYWNSIYPNGLDLLDKEISILIKTLETIIDNLGAETGSNAESMKRSPKPLVAVDKIEYFKEEDLPYFNSKVFRKTRKVENKFFDRHRNKKLNETPNLSEKYLNLRQSDAPAAIDLNDISNRTAITSDAGAVAISLAPFTPEDIIGDTEITGKLGWNNSGGKTWNYEKIYRGKKDAAHDTTEDINISSQYAPSAGNLGNFVMKGIGDYGTNGSNHILRVINQMTKEEVESEKKLAKILLSSSKDGTGITEEILRDAGMWLSNTATERRLQVVQINRIAYLCLSKEIARRKEQGFKNDKKGSMVEVPELPFGLGIAMALKLIADGHLKMKEVFDSNAEYGVATGKEIMHSRILPETLRKFKNVYDLYQEHYGTEVKQKKDIKNKKGKEKIKKEFPSSEKLHQLLLETYGGASDTSGDEYSSEDEDPPKKAKIPENKTPTYRELYKIIHPS
jgi:hypothetical protein